MKNKTLIILILFTLLSSVSCDVLKLGTARIVLDGALTETYTSYGSPRFEGYVKNVGNGTAYNVAIEITCYSDARKTTIIDTVTGFPANLGNIPPDTRAYFEAVSFNIDSHDKIKAKDYVIDWLDRH